MDPYDQAQHHPSESIPDAAYPDAPYRPGEGQQDRPSPQSYSHSQASQALSSPSSPNSHHSTWRHDVPSSSDTAMIPDVPPPPYAPSAPHLSAPEPAVHVHTSINHQNAIPLQRLQPVAPAGSSSHSPSDNHQGNPYAGYYGPSSVSPQTLTQSQSASLHTPCGKQPIMDGRARSRRRAKICFLILGLGIIGILALIAGVGLGIYNGVNDDDNDG